MEMTWRSSWLLNKFSFTVPYEMYGEQFWEYPHWCGAVKSQKVIFDASSTPWVADLNGECSNLHYMHVELTSMHLIIYSYGWNSYLVRHLSHFIHQVESSLADVVTIFGFLGYMAIALLKGKS